MPRKKKEEQEEQPSQQEEQFQEQLLIAAPSDDMPPVALRLQLLGLSKEILEHRSHLKWETHTKFVDVTIEDVIEGARDLLAFVCEFEE